MAPHEHAEEFVASYTKLMQGNTDIGNFQKVLDMKVHKSDPFWALKAHSQIKQVRGGGDNKSEVKYICGVICECSLTGWATITLYMFLLNGGWLHMELILTHVHDRHDICHLLFRA